MIWKFLVDLFVDILIYVLSWLPVADPGLDVSIAGPIVEILQWGYVITFLVHWQVLFAFVGTAVSFEIARLLLWIWTRIKGAIFAS
jgi:hypothetical protein